MVERSNGLTAFFVAPMRCDTKLCVLVHVVRSNLHFDGLALRSDHGGMQRAIVVFLGIRDVVVELARNIRPQVVNGSERRVALFDVLNEDSHRADVVQRVQAAVFTLHFSPDAIDVLRSTGNVGVDAIRLQFIVQLNPHSLDEALAFCAFFVKRFGDPEVGVGIEIAERQILEFPLELPYAEAIRECRVDFARLNRECLLNRRRCIACFAQTKQLFGDSNQNQTHIRYHRQ